MNTIGTLFRLTTFGESHGTAIGGIVDGMPAGVTIDLDRLMEQMQRRSPGGSPLTSSRREPDRVSLLSGVMDGVTLGTPIGFLIPNTNIRPTDYDPLQHAFRPSHADFTYQAKYGLRDHRGGGRASARETACRVVAGALAMQALQPQGITFGSRIMSLGKERRPDGLSDQDVSTVIADALSRGDTVGGVIECTVKGVPAGLGEPLYGKLESMLAAAMLSISAAVGFEYGLGFDACSMPGSAYIDPFSTDADGNIITETNHSGGIQGGISNGNDITFRVGFKPIASLMQPVRTVDDRGNHIELNLRGRHDPTAVIRALPVVEAMAACVILDALLLNRAARI